MVVGQPGDHRTDRVFQALADATRRDIVRRVMQEPESVSSLARRYPMSFAAVQKHVCVLERAAVVSKERRGREQLVRGNPDGLRQAAELLDELEHLWVDRIDRFGEALSALAAHDKAADRTQEGAPSCP
jgi:DNA-binding transcriptional ArsR family regulator